MTNAYRGYLTPAADHIREMLRNGHRPLVVAKAVMDEFTHPYYWRGQTPEWKVNAAVATLHYAFRDDIPKVRDTTEAGKTARYLRASGMTLREAGRQLHCSPERIRQLVAKTDREARRRIMSAILVAYHAVYIKCEPSQDAFPVGEWQTWTPERQFDDPTA